MANKWLTHVKKTMKTMKSKGTYKKGDGLKKVIMEAKKSYKKHRGGEEEKVEETMPTVEMPAPVVASAGRRKTRRRSRK
jgi:hypothetical protein